MPLRVIITGGSGKAGRHVIAELLKYGHTILNLDLVPFGTTAVHTMKCDVTDLGQVFSAFNTPMRLSEPLDPNSPKPPDAVIHFAAYSTPMIVPDSETFRCNVMGAYNVVEAACKLGIKKIILASSVTTYGVSFGQGHKEYTSFPCTEDMDVNPTDPYALSKVVAERIARSYASRFGVDIYCLRIGRIFAPEEYDSEMFASHFHEPEKWFTHGWSYTDARDLGLMCELALQKSGLGFQIFNATNDSITNPNPTVAFLKGLYPNIPFTREMEEFEAPLTNRKIKEVLGFQEQHPWTTYFTRRYNKPRIDIMPGDDEAMSLQEEGLTAMSGPAPRRSAQGSSGLFFGPPSLS